MKKSIKIMIFGIAFASILITTASAATMGGGKVTASSLNFRSEASTDATVLACVGFDTPLVIMDKVNDDWYSVLYEGATGYMNSAYIENVSTLDFSIGKGRVNGDSVRLRQSPTYDAGTVTYLNQGDAISITGICGEWFKAEFAGNTGYVHSEYINILKTSTTRSLGTEGQAIVDWAKEFLGLDYIYGGSSPSGFDCSGFTYYLFNNSGYKISRCASSQWYDGVQVTKDELMVGDLVFFSNDSSDSIEHVGIYIGDDQFIHSSSGGGDVRINDLTDYYYTNNWYGAVRVF